MIVSWQQYELTLKQPFKLSHGTFPTRNCIILSLSDGEFTGYGEATEITYYGWDISDMNSQLERVKHQLAEITIDDPRNYGDLLIRVLPDHPQLRSAIDCALWDIYGHYKEATTSELLGIPREKIKESSYTFAVNNLDGLNEEIKNHPWPIAKIKMGTDIDDEILNKLNILNSDKPLWIDANEGWTLDFIIDHSSILTDLGSRKLEFVEQPFKDKNAHLIKTLPAFPFFYMADESCQKYDDIERCAENYGGVNIKLMKAGGISEAYRMLLKAKELGLKTMAGCMTETSIGISAMAQLSPMFDYLDLDGNYLIAEDPAEGVNIEKGVLSFQNGNGNGAWVPENT